MTDLRPASDIHAADWVVPGVRKKGSEGTVGSLVPAVFERYARVFHPASRDERPGDESIEVRWAEVASANNRVMHPVAEWGSLTGSWQLKRQDCVWDHGPREGQLPQRVGERLAEALAPFTDRANRCYFGVWEGWGDPSFMFFFTEGTPEEEQRRVREEAEAGAAAWRGLLDHAPKFTLPDRPMHLLEAPLDSIREFYEQHRKPPSIWWPEDRTWCVATDIDLMSTYLGGNASAIQPLLGDERIEALPVPVDQRVDWEADSINPLPEPPYK